MNQPQKYDTKLIEEICASTWKDLYRFIYYKVQNREEAEDITQETYSKALTYFQRENIPVVKYSSFLKTIAINIIRDNWRKKKRVGNFVNLEDVKPEEIAKEDFTDMTANRSFIENALDCLSEEQRRVIDLRIIKGYSAKETAKVIGKKEGTIRVIQFRALQILSELLEES